MHFLVMDRRQDLIRVCELLGNIADAQRRLRELGQNRSAAGRAASLKLCGGALLFERPTESVCQRGHLTQRVQHAQQGVLVLGLPDAKADAGRDPAEFPLRDHSSAPSTPTTGAAAC
mgnify:CR=1 FL=1